MGLSHVPKRSDIQDLSPQEHDPTQPTADLFGLRLSKDLAHPSTVSSQGQRQCFPYCYTPAQLSPGSLSPGSPAHVSPPQPGSHSTSVGPQYSTFTLILRVDTLAHITVKETEALKLKITEQATAVSPRPMVPKLCFQPHLAEPHLPNPCHQKQDLYSKTRACHSLAKGPHTSY